MEVGWWAKRGLGVDGLDWGRLVGKVVVRVTGREEDVVLLLFVGVSSDDSVLAWRWECDDVGRRVGNAAA